MTAILPDVEHPPAFYFSVSGAAKSHLSPLVHLRLLEAVRASHVLVSCYDLIRASADVQCELVSGLERLMEAGATVVLDSGGYEARWLQDRSWSLQEYARALELLDTHYVLAFDWGEDPQEELWARSLDLIGSEDRFVPIVHAESDELLEPVLACLEEYSPPLVALAERELGDGIMEVRASISAVRMRLEATFECTPPLHVLGAGNPLSILAYYDAGASSFDGLDWCQTVADFATATMHHSKHLDLFAHQSAEGMASANYFTRLLGHNCAFYRSWMQELDFARADSRIGMMVDEILTEH